MSHIIGKSKVIVGKSLVIGLPSVCYDVEAVSSRIAFVVGHAPCKVGGFLGGGLRDFAARFLTTSDRSFLKPLNLLKYIRGMDRFEQQCEAVPLLPCMVEQVSRCRPPGNEKDLAI